MNVHQTAAAYLRSIAKGGGVTAVEHVTGKSISESNITLASTYQGESLHELVARLEREFAAIPAATPDPEIPQRFEVEESKVILFLRPRLARCFNGYLGNKPVFSYQPQLAQEFTVEEADQVQKQLLVMGFETEQRLVIVRGTETF
jgi:hypothetical protein